MNGPTIKTLRRWIIGQTIVVLIGFFAVWLTGYAGRREVVKANRAACVARRPVDIKQGLASRARAADALSDGRLSTSKLETTAADALLSRAAVPCATRYPWPSAIGFR